VLEALAEQGQRVPPSLLIGVPDRFIEHGARAKLLERIGFTPAALADRIATALGVPAAEPRALRR